jgi:hypothetical protein
MLFNISKQKIAHKTMNILETLTEEYSIEDKISYTLGREIMKDEDVRFIVEGFKRKYGIGDYKVEVRPAVQPHSLLIEGFSIYIEGKPCFSSKGMDDLLSKLSEAVITTDKVKVESFLRDIKVALGA